MFKRQLIQIHRWFGLVMCVFFVTWFLSGFVMLYADFSGFGEMDRLLHNKPLDLKACNFEPDRLSRLLSADTSWRSIRIDMLFTRPVFRLESAEGDLQSFYADNGSPVKALTRADADAIAVECLQHNYYYSKHNNSRLPVLKLEYNDPGQTWYYADLSNGTVVLKNDRSGRINRWLYHGLHSLDFFNFQHHRPGWDVLIILLLTGGTAVSITGLVIGIRRLLLRL